MDKEFRFVLWRRTPNTNHYYSHNNDDTCVGEDFRQQNQRTIAFAMRRQEKCGQRWHAVLFMKWNKINWRIRNPSYLLIFFLFLFSFLFFSFAIDAEQWARTITTTAYQVAMLHAAMDSNWSAEQEVDMSAKHFESSFKQTSLFPCELIVFVFSFICSSYHSCCSTLTKQWGKTSNSVLASYSIRLKFSHGQLHAVG